MPSPDKTRRGGPSRSGPVKQDPEKLPQRRKGEDREEEKSGPYPGASEVARRKLGKSEVEDLEPDRLEVPDRA
jgi:hypothetical protein